MKRLILAAALAVSTASILAGQSALGLDPTYVAHHDAKALILKGFLASAAKGYTSARRSAKEIYGLFLR